MRGIQSLQRKHCYASVNLKYIFLLLSTISEPMNGDYFHLFAVIRSGPKVSVEVSNLSGQNQLHFFCDFIPIEGIRYNLSIQWYLSTGSYSRREIASFKPRKFVSGFRNETSMTESHLRNNGINNLPFTVSYR